MIPNHLLPGRFCSTKLKNQNGGKVDQAECFRIFHCNFGKVYFRSTFLSLFNDLRQFHFVDANRQRVTGISDSLKNHALRQDGKKRNAVHQDSMTVLSSWR